MNLSVYEKQYNFCPTCKTKLQRKPLDGRKLFCCPSCNFVFWNNPKPVVSILLHKNNKILVIKRAHQPFKDYWCLPGGFINHEETPQAAIERETEEEVGIKLSNIKKLFGVYRIANDPRGVNIDIIFEQKIKSKKISLSSEHQEYKFFSVDKLPKKIAYKHRKIINDWRLSQQI